MREEMIRKVCVLFKTHFDYGYTALARDVYDRYMNQYIPAALSRAEEMRAEGEHRFIWTTGSWLIDEYLRQANDENRRRMERAIEAGDVRWHGLPFTTHTELMDRELFEYGLSISQALDSRFQMRTTAAKLTDVPGHTRAIIDLLADAGIRFLHIGDNPTSRPPEVPELFVWRAPSGRELDVIYNVGYGRNTVIPGTGVMVYFAHTGDNAGPQSMEQIQALYRQMQEEYPGAEIAASTLEDVAAEVAKIRHTLPVITGEMGDTWIHGVASDPRKVSEYRALLRLRSGWDGEDRATANRCLLRIPEHTWGSFIDPIMNDRHLYARPSFEKVRGEARYRFMEDTWNEQREFVREVPALLTDETHRVQARAALAECGALRVCRGQDRPLDAVIAKNGWTVALDASGAIRHMTCGERIIADDAHPVGTFLYEAFSRNETDRYAHNYIETHYFPNLEGISWELYDKPGIQCAISEYASAGAVLKALRETENGLQADMTVESELVERFGCPAELTLDLSLRPDEAQFAFHWRRKTASRVPEGIWIGMHPLAGDYKVRKLGEWIDPAEIIPYGNRQMCATDFGVAWADLSVETLDTAVLAFGEPSLWRFDAQAPRLENGVWFNLYNNMWNTNFPMWYDEDALFRFTLRIGGETGIYG